MTDDETIRLLESEGYADIRKMPDGEFAAIRTFVFTCAIIYGMTPWGHDERWCYRTYEDAKKALDAWNGEGEPEGWHRHPASGRRRDEAGNEYINF